MEFRTQASAGVFVMNQSPAILSQRPAPSTHVIDNGFENLFDDFQQSEDQSADPQPLPGPPLSAGQSDSHTVYHRPGQQTITQFVGMAEKRATQLENRARRKPKSYDYEKKQLVLEGLKAKNQFFESQAS